jgi:hypothetical protein
MIFLSLAPKIKLNKIIHTFVHTKQVEQLLSPCQFWSQRLRKLGHFSEYDPRFELQVHMYSRLYFDEKIVPNFKIRSQIQIMLISDQKNRAQFKNVPVLISQDS